MGDEIERRDIRRAVTGQKPLCPCGSLAYDHGYGEHRGHRNYPPPRNAGELNPEWVMCGVDVPAGKRLYASRDLKGSAFQLAMDQYGNGDGWHLITTMQKMLVITKPTYAACLAELMRIWANWDSEGRELPAGTESRAL